MTRPTELFEFDVCNRRWIPAAGFQEYIAHGGYVYCSDGAIVSGDFAEVWPKLLDKKAADVLMKTSAT